MVAAVPITAIRISRHSLEITGADRGLAQLWWWQLMMISSRADSTCCFHQDQVSPVTAPAGEPPPQSCRPTGYGKSFRSLIMRNRIFPTSNEYRSQMPSIRQGLRALSTAEVGRCHLHSSAELIAGAYQVKHGAGIIPTLRIDDLGLPQSVFDELWSGADLAEIELGVTGGMALGCSI
jgi:hypothetical protein